MATGNQTVILCPMCKKEVIWDEQPATRPFCSERCKLIDLGEWVSEEKRIPGESVNIESAANTLTDEDSFLH